MSEASTPVVLTPLGPECTVVTNVGVLKIAAGGTSHQKSPSKESHERNGRGVTETWSASGLSTH